MWFEWDPKKDRANQRKHGVSFTAASFVFGDPDLVLIEDRVDESGEERCHGIGAVHLPSGRKALLVVVHAY